MVQKLLFFFGVKVTPDPAERLRTHFLWASIARIKTLIAAARRDEARVTTSKLRRYFEWHLQNVDPEQRSRLAAELEALSTFSEVKG